jgi:hypothetical protein
VEAEKVYQRCFGTGHGAWRFDNGERERQIDEKDRDSPNDLGA